MRNPFRRRDRFYGDGTRPAEYGEVPRPEPTEARQLADEIRECLLREDAIGDALRQRGIEHGGYLDGRRVVRIEIESMTFGSPCLPKFNPGTLYPVSESSPLTPQPPLAPRLRSSARIKLVVQDGPEGGNGEVRAFRINVTEVEV